jgi:hypothetical protein
MQEGSEVDEGSISFISRFREITVRWNRPTISLYGVKENKRGG